MAMLKAPFQGFVIFSPSVCRRLASGRIMASMQQLDFQWGRQSLMNKDGEVNN